MATEGVDSQGVGHVSGFGQDQVNSSTLGSFEGLAASAGAPVIAAPWTVMFTPGGAMFGIVNVPHGWNIALGFPSGYNVSWDAVTGMSTIYGADYVTVMGFMVNPNGGAMFGGYVMSVVENPVDQLDYGFVNVGGTWLGLPMANNYAGIVGFKMNNAGSLMVPRAGRGIGDGPEGGPNR